MVGVRLTIFNQPLIFTPLVQHVFIQQLWSAWLYGYTCLIQVFVAFPLAFREAQCAVSWFVNHNKMWGKDNWILASFRISPPPSPTNPCNPRASQALAIRRRKMASHIPNVHKLQTPYKVPPIGISQHTLTLWVAHEVGEKFQHPK